GAAAPSGSGDRPRDQGLPQEPDGEEPQGRRGQQRHEARPRVADGAERELTGLVDRDGGKAQQRAGRDRVGSAHRYFAAPATTLAKVSYSCRQAASNSRAPRKWTSSPSCWMSAWNDLSCDICRKAASSLSTTAAGVPLGAATPRHWVKTTSTPSSCRVGTAGSWDIRFESVTARARILPAPRCGRGCARKRELRSRCPPRTASSAGPPPS